MHLLAAQPGGIADGSEPVDLGQTAGDIVVLSAADTELANLAAARSGLGADAPSLRLANVMNLSHNLSVDLYVEQVIAQAKLVIVRLLGGAGYWSYGVEQVVDICRRNRIALALLPGDDTPDPELARLSSVPAEAAHRLWQYCVHGGPDNARHFLAFAASLVGWEIDWAEPVPVPRAGLYWPGLQHPSLALIRRRWTEGRPVAAIVCYRALVQSGSVLPMDALIEALQGKGLNPLPIFAASLKEPVSAGIVSELLAEAPPAVILNATGFAVSSPVSDRRSSPLDGPGCPVLQVVFSGGTLTAWEAGTFGLSPRDLAMNVALPEVDGRVLAGAVSFKAAVQQDALTQSAVVAYEPVRDRIEFVAELAARWADLRAASASDRRVALVLANYPNRDGRIGNGVGLDTPAGTLTVLRALAAAGYRVGDRPANGNALIEALQSGPTNAGIGGRETTEELPRPDYELFFAGLPAAVREAVLSRWGPPERDPFYVHKSLDCGAFAIPALRFGNIVVGLQPARGYNIDLKASYHDPALVPPHGYLAFYAWLRESVRVHAVIHMGKHGNLEWLPGKALALSGSCFPEVALGPTPHIYPFIVNDPGEGTQAKRRSAAVIVDHLTPPLTRADSYGAHAELERLVDEYYQAAGVDPRRLKLLREQILDQTRSIGLDVDCGISPDDDDDAALGKLDNYLCEIKEMQIRDGLHVFGEAPRGDSLVDLLVALTRLPREAGCGGDASLIRALAADLGMEDLDPLDCEMAQTWTGPRPTSLDRGRTWRTAGDTVERLEVLAADLVAGRCQPDSGWSATRAVLDRIAEHVRPAVEACGDAEIAAILKALDGRFVEPGPSGAPTRGRLDVLPTGRNFYSVDTRTVPTPAAWQLGWKSASLVIDRYRQDHGEWPRRMALSAWGTANMRTGGDDIAQALALMGVQPRWDAGSNRVVGFEVMPASVLGRPRVDVTLRVSGFFRDAFPAQIDLLDSAVRAVAALDEPDQINPLAANINAQTADFVAAGTQETEARRRAGFRVFGSKPGAYGAGLQALIDERGWRDEADLARAYVAWGGYAYGSGAEGAPEHTLFETRLSGIQAVLHNQDNREHDLLDSDDYYQFEGGLAAAVGHHSGNRPTVLHNDHSRPESPRIRTLEEEIGRVVRARVVNPKWIAGVMRHGYKGAFEMAATVDYLFAFAATTRAVRDHHFDAVYQAYLADDRVRAFLLDNNPAAAREMAQRLAEALDRGLWAPRSNTVHVMLSQLARDLTENA